MKKRWKEWRQRSGLSLLVLVTGLGLNLPCRTAMIEDTSLPGFEPSRERGVDVAGGLNLREHIKTIYDFNSWPVSSIRRRGVKIDGLIPPGLELVDVRFSTAGTRYIYRYNEDGHRISITIKVHRSNRDACKGVVDYLTLSSQYLSRGEGGLGTVSWRRDEYPVVVFVRDNVSVVINSALDEEGEIEELLGLASLIDREIRETPKVSRRRRLRAPKIIALEVSPLPLKVGEKAELLVEAVSASGTPLYSSYQATGGNILKGKGGRVFYLPGETGLQTINVVVGNEYNVSAERTRSVRVAE